MGDNRLPAIFYKGVFMKCIYYGIFVMLFVNTFLFLPSSNAMGNWELLRDKDGIKVYKKHSVDSKIVEFKGVTVVNAKIETTFEAMLDFEATSKLFLFVEEFRVLKGLERKNNNFTMSTYLSTDLPWPISNRDSIGKVTGTLSNDYTKVTLDVLPLRKQVVPLKKGYIRISKFSTKWVLESIADNKTSVSFSMRADPEGYIPAWAVNLISKNQPFHTLRNLKQMVKLPKYIKAEKSTKLLTAEY